jgi:pyrimidine operon attenuation protein/uracil phosphoribosyltransferase
VHREAFLDCSSAAFAANLYFDLSNLRAGVSRRLPAAALAQASRRFGWQAGGSRGSRALVLRASCPPEAAMPQVMDADRMSRALMRIAHEILERNRGLEELALVGIRTRGVPIARRIARALKEINRDEVPTGALDITLYRDDLMRHAIGPQPVVRHTEIPFSIDDRKILLVDDVLYTGRTIRAALDALIDFGRPRAIQLIVLVDRGHRELPIKADYVGKNLPTSLKQSVQVRLQEIDGTDEIVIEGEP